MTCKNITISRDLISLFRSAAKLASIFEGSLRHFNKPTSFSFCGILVEQSSVDMLMTSLVCVIPKIIKLKSSKRKKQMDSNAEVIPYCNIQIDYFKRYLIRSMVKCNRIWSIFGTFGKSLVYD